MSNRVVFGLMRDAVTVEQVLANLGKAGFTAAEISVLMPSHRAARELARAHEDGARADVRGRGGAGAAVGGALGLLGLLGGLGALAIPGIGPLVAAGPIVAALGGAAVGAAMGSVAGGLIGLGIPAAQARLYEGKLRAGHVLVAVHTMDVPHVAAATTVLETQGVDDMLIASERSRPTGRTPSHDAVS